MDSISEKKMKMESIGTGRARGCPMNKKDHNVALRAAVWS